MSIETLRSAALAVSDAGEQGAELFSALGLSERKARAAMERGDKLELEVADYQRSHERARDDFGKLHDERHRLLGKLANAENTINAARGLIGRWANDPVPVNLGPVIHKARLDCAEQLESVLRGPTEQVERNLSHASAVASNDLSNWTNGERLAESHARELARNVAAAEAHEKTREHEQFRIGMELQSARAELTKAKSFTTLAHGTMSSAKITELEDYVAKLSVQVAALQEAR